MSVGEYSGAHCRYAARGDIRIAFNRACNHPDTIYRMNGRTFRRLVLALLVPGIVIAESYWSYSCIPYDPSRFQISYVDPALLHDSIYLSYYRSILAPSPPYTDDADEVISRDPNIAEWYGYFGGNVSLRSLNDVIYKAGRELLESTLDGLEQGAPENPPDMIVRVDDWTKEQYPDRTDEELIDYLRSNEQYWSIDTIMTGSLLREVIRRNDRDFLRYMIFAKLCEPNVASSDGWDDPVRGPALMKERVQEGIRLHDSFSSEYLKLRQAYQIVRLAHYGGDNTGAVSLYDRLVLPNRAESILRYWAFGHKAGAVKRLGDTASSNYLFSLVFDSCESRRQRAVIDFELGPDEKFWEPTLKLARNDHERSTLWMMRGLLQTKLSLEPLREMVKLAPTSSRTASMMMREVRRIERLLFSDKMTRSLETRRLGGYQSGYWDNEEERYIDTGVTNAIDDYGAIRRHIATGDSWDTLLFYKHDSVLTDIISGRDYVRAFRRLLMDVARDNRIPDPALWYMAAGYINLMDNEYSLADECLGDAMRNTRGNADLEQQIRLLDYLAAERSGRRVEPDPDIARALQWMRNRQSEHHHHAFDRVMVRLGREYMLQDDIPRAILAFDAGSELDSRNILLDIYATDDDMTRLDDLLNRTSLDHMDRMLVKDFSLSRDALYDVRACRLMREGEYRAALRMFERVSPGFWNLPDSVRDSWDGSSYRHFWSSTDTTRLGGESLIDEWSRYTDTELDTIGGTIPSARNYSRLEFAREMVRLLDIAERNPEREDSAYFRMGNLLFNSPYWGYPDALWQGSMVWTLRGYTSGAGTWPFNIEELNERLRKPIALYVEQQGARRQAREMYRTSMERTSDKELAAHCAYMIDLCTKRPQSSLAQMYSADNQDRTGYDLLLTMYRDTRFAERILSQCSTYKYFEKQRRGEG